MARFSRSFDPTAHDTEQRKEFPNLPDGDYELEIVESEIKSTTKGSGEYLKLKYQVLKPEQFKGRFIWSNINVVNSSAQAQEIGEKELAALCRAMGYDKPLDESEDLHHRSFMAKVGLGKASNGYPAKNEIKRFYFPDEDDLPEAKAEPLPAAANDNQPARSAPAAATAAAPTQRRGWGRK